MRSVCQDLDKPHLSSASINKDRLEDDDSGRCGACCACENSVSNCVLVLPGYCFKLS